MSVFSATDRATWPETLTAYQVALIYQRSVLGLKKSCQRHVFVPAPFKVKPWRWRRIDVERDLGHAAPLNAFRRSA